MAKRRIGLRGTPQEHAGEVDRVFKLVEDKARGVEKALANHDCFGAVTGVIHLAALQARLDTNAESVRHTPKVKHMLSRTREHRERLFTRASYCIKREW